MVSKMLLIEREHEMRPSTSHPPRQLMVTQSPMLAEKISLYYRQLYTSLPNIQLQEAGGLTDRMAELPEKLTELGDIHFPVITTVSKVLAHSLLLLPTPCILISLLLPGLGND